MSDLLEVDSINKLNIYGKIYNFDVNDLQQLCLLGSSQFAVEKYLHWPSGHSIAIKKIYLPVAKLKINPLLKINKEKIINEIKILQSLQKSTNITEFYGAGVYNRQVWICMESMEKSLQEIVQLNKYIPW